MGRTYSRLLKVFEVYPERMTKKVIWERCNEIFGTDFLETSITQDLSRAVKDGVVKKDKYGFYYVDGIKEIDYNNL